MGNISPTFISGRVCPLNAHPCRGLAGDIPAGDVSSAQPALPRARRDAPLGHSRAPASEPAGTARNVTSPYSEGRRVSAAQTRVCRTAPCQRMRRGARMLPAPAGRVPHSSPRGQEQPWRRNVPRHPRELRGHGDKHRPWRPGGTRCRGSGTGRPGPTRGGAAGAEPSPPQGAEGKGRAAGAPRDARPRSPSMFSRSLMCCRLQPVSSRLSSASGR